MRGERGSETERVKESRRERKRIIEGERWNERDREE